METETLTTTPDTTTRYSLLEKVAIGLMILILLPIVLRCFLLIASAIVGMGIVAKETVTDAVARRRVRKAEKAAAAAHVA